MRKYLLLCCLGLTWAAPQDYSGAPSNPLTEETKATISEVFGSSGSYTDNSDNSNVDVLVQVIQEQYPDDYDKDNLVKEQANVEVDNVFENCHEYTESQGYECVPYYQCHNGSIITDGAGLIDIRNGFAALTPADSKCPGFLDVCCKDPDFIPPPPPAVKHVAKCGRRNNNGLGARITGFSESESQFGEWPHMCAVLHAKPAEPKAGSSGTSETVNLYQCGGSLIAPGVVLTAAHCVDKFRQNPRELKVRCGEWDTQHQTEPRPHQDRDVSNLEIHPEFEPRNLQNDFAVLFTSQEFELTDHIDTACLPQAGESFDGTTCFATGWGKDKFGAAGNYQVVLKEIDLPVVNHDACQDRLRLTRLGKKFKLHDSFVCAGGVNGKDTCKGDGGSPLVCPSKLDPDTYIQAGIVAWGVGCGEDGTPGVYADVSQATCWIDQAITCHFGGGNSYLGYTTNVCQTWLQDKISSLTTKRDAAGKFARIFQNMIDGYTKCNVIWEQPSEPLVDISDLARQPGVARDSSNVYAEVAQSEKQEEQAGSY